MTDITELVNRMRGLAEYVDDCEAAADALAAQAKEIEKQKHFFALAEKHRDELDARIAELEAREADALRGATILAVSLAEKHWPENMDWRPLDETAGVITQINNMCAGLGARIAELETALNGWQQWWGLPWQDRRPDIADLRYRAARAALNGEKA